MNRATSPEDSKGTRDHTKSLGVGLASVVVIRTAVVEGVSGVEEVEETGPGPVLLVDAPEAHAEPPISRATTQTPRLLRTNEP